MSGLEKLHGKMNTVSAAGGKSTVAGGTSSEPREYDEILAGTSTASSIKKFGITHYKYSDCKASDLTSVDYCKVHKACAEAFKKMREDAEKENLDLRVVSGYRSSTYQITVFKKKFKGQYPSNQQMENRLKYSAPSGFSEHHTGLAVDINETEEVFKNTAEYKWLEKHAKEYGFELSFPEDNAQHLGFEPWHWRYVGKNGEYKAVFEAARQNDPRFKSEYE